MNDMGHEPNARAKDTDESDDLRLSAAAATCSQLLFDFTSTFTDVVMEHRPMGRDYSLVLLRLGLSCQTTSESALILTANGRCWDADCLIRSVLEGTMKMAYLTTGSPDTLERRLYEYTDSLTQINHYKRRQRARVVINRMGEPGRMESRPLLDLLTPDGELDDFIARTPRKARRELEQKWSFNGMLQEIASSDSEVVRALIPMSFPYGMSSHVLHQDWDGISMVMERARRQEARRLTVSSAHGFRTVSDTLAFAALRLRLVCDLIGLSADVGRVLNDRASQFIEQHRFFADEWMSVEYPETPEPDPST